MNLSGTTSTGGVTAMFCAWWRGRDGGVAVTVAVTVAVLVGLAALSLDLGRMYNLSTELDNAADAYALAGATQLDKTSGACARAIAAAVNAATRNQETFASNTAGPITIDTTPDLSNANIRFLSKIVKNAQGLVTGNYITTNMTDCDNNAEYIEVTIDTDTAGSQYQVEFFLAGVVGGPSAANPIGYAVAGIGSAYCGEVPMFMCPVNGESAATYWSHIQNYDYTGNGLWLKSGTNSTQWGDGNFGFLELAGAGVPNLEKALGQISDPLQCLGTEDVQTEPGNNSGARDGFNTRFDIYDGNLKSKQGDDDWRPAANAVKGMMRQLSNNCTFGGQGYNFSPTPYNGPGTNMSQVAAMGFPMDDCAYGGSCDATTGNFGRMGDGQWGRTDYFMKNHGMAPPAPGSSQSAATYEDIDWTGSGGDGQMSRYEAYLWELGRLSTDTTYGTAGAVNHLVDNTSATPGPGSFPQTGEYGGQQCSTATPSDTGLDRDRRVMQVFLVDCDNVPGGIKGKTVVPPQYIIGTIDLFLITPWVVNGNQHQIYTEIIGPGGSATFKKQVAKKIVQLYE